MMDEYMKEYCRRMDRIILSDSADRTILDDIRKAEARGISYGRNGQKMYVLSRLRKR